LGHNDIAAGLVKTAPRFHYHELLWKQRNNQTPHFVAGVLKVAVEGLTGFGIFLLPERRKEECSRIGTKMGRVEFIYKHAISLQARVLHVYLCHGRHFADHAACTENKTSLAR
jgi:hypothetical protein